jgi:hypothetical protein
LSHSLLYEYSNETNLQEPTLDLESLLATAEFGRAAADRLVAIHQLKQYGSSPQVKDVLSRLANDADPAIRAYAQIVLAELNKPPGSAPAE